MRWETPTETACACISTNLRSSASAARRNCRLSPAASMPSAAPPRPCGASARRSVSGTSAAPPAAICRHTPALRSTARGSVCGWLAASSTATTAACSWSVKCTATPSARRRSSSHMGASSGVTASTATPTAAAICSPAPRSSESGRAPAAPSPSPTRLPTAPASSSRRAAIRSSMARLARPSHARVAHGTTLASGSASCSGATASSSWAAPASKSSESEASAAIARRHASTRDAPNSPSASMSMASFFSGESAPGRPSASPSPGWAQKSSRQAVII
mmetsp:Transcript_22984/g.72029  ORF Transcript_22984/g.72029 Transcript_22984/m.72029 type:complete len:276 (+) Transcript_22984:1086-1913(+)